MKDLIFSVLLCICFSVVVNAQANIWQPVQQHDNIFEFKLDKDALMSQVEQVAFYNGKESLRNSSQSVSFPGPTGKSEKFEVFRTQVMHPKLAAKFPYIKTFIGISKENPGRQIRFSISHKQFAGFIMDPTEEVIYISQVENDIYQAYAKSDYVRLGQFSQAFTCGVKSHSINTPVESSQMKTPRGDVNLRTYRLALACTGEYATFHGGNVPDVMDAFVVSMARVNGIYERDLGITMVLIPDNDDLIFLNGNTDPYTNNNGGAMLGQNQNTIDNIIGTANYDIGHVFSTGGGGIASLDSPCNASRKARGVTGLGAPIGDPFNVDYVAHEMGHQFGGNHTQNNSCQRNNATAMEPGSASTIMGYAGICNPNVQNNSDDYFHAISLQEMTIYSNNGNGNTCAVIGDTGNNQVDLTVEGTNYALPVDTPFRLVAEGTDEDENDVLTYCWEQMDNEAATMPPSPANTGGPMFRSFDPTESPIRYFPRIQNILNNTPSTWEVLPIVSRNMDFRCTVRDNSPGNGTIADADVFLTFSDQAGPFRVSTQNTFEEWTAFSRKFVEWDVANTDMAPVSCSEVDILMSLDGGFTYDVEVATNLPNNGFAEITVPNVESNNARIMVVCSDNIFFDINNSNLVVRSTQFLLSPEPSLLSSCDMDAASLIIDYSPVGNFNENISLSVENLPENVIATFSEEEISTAGTIQLDFAGLLDAAPGVYNIDLIGTGETENYQTIITLEIYTSQIAEPQLSLPNNGTIGVASRPVFGWDVDGNVSSYGLEISTNPAFPEMETILIEGYTPGSQLNQDLEAGTVYYWRVSASNPCAMDNSGSRTFSFQTGGEVCESVASLTNNIPILDSGPNEVRSLLSVTNNVSISRVTATIDVSHDNVGDLVAEIVSPSGGPTITVMNRPGVPATPIGCTGDDLLLTFDDRADLTADDLENTCENTSPALAGTFQPIQPMSTFSGLNSQGIWLLEVNDFRSGAGGTLNGWTLEVCNLEELEGDLILVNIGLVVDAETNTKISAMELNVSDSNPDQLVYTITAPTQFGDLLLDDGTGNMKILSLGDQFAQTDLDNEFLYYVSGDGTESQDAFNFDVVNSENIWSSGNQFSIQIIAALSAELVITNLISCFGANDASLTIEASGGIPGYSYSIDGVDFQDEATFDNLGPGDYSVVVRDSDDQIVETNSVSLTEPQEIFVDVDQDGYTITVLAEQGVEPYMYSLDGITYQEDPVFMVPGEGDYVAYVIDSNGCSNTLDFFVMASSTNELADILNLSISPNPGDGIYTIELFSQDRLDVNMRLVDAVGKSIMNQQWILNGNDKIEIDITQFASGQYILILTDDKNRQGAYPLVKN